MQQQGIKRLIQRRAQALWFGLFPPHCQLCGQPADQRLDVCSGCRADLSRLTTCCARCAEPLTDSSRLCGRCQQKLPVFDSVFAPFIYTQPLTRLITSFKYRRQTSAGHSLGVLLAEAVIDAHRTDKLEQPDCLVPVPLHPWRQLSRGFNQSGVLARDIARDFKANAIDVPVNQHLLERTRRTQPQSGLSLPERRKNLKGAFQVNGKPPKQVALVDDVMTSGSTVNECARVLKQAGCEVVQVWVVARAERPGT